MTDLMQVHRGVIDMGLEYYCISNNCRFYKKLEHGYCCLFGVGDDDSLEERGCNEFFAELNTRKNLAECITDTVFRLLSESDAKSVDDVDELEINVRDTVLEILENYIIVSRI